MATIVLADDELNVLQLIKHLIDCPGAQIVGEALNGLDAYRLLLEKKPDILITDIRMPGLNGLELIKKVRQDLPELEIVVISGYREFDYVQSGLKYGVQEYLLKPIEKKEINSVLRRIIQKKQGISEQKKYVEDIEQSLENSVNMLRREYLSKLFLFHSQINDPDEFLRIFHFKPGNYCAAVLKVDFQGQYNESPANIHPLLEDISKTLLAIIRPGCHDTAYLCYGTRAFFLFNYPAGVEAKEFWDKPENGVAHIKNILINEGYKYLSLRFKFGIGKSVKTVDALPESYESAQVALANRLNPNLCAVIKYDDLKPDPAAMAKPAIPEDIQESLAALVEALDAEKIIILFEETVSRHIEDSGLFDWIYTFTYQVIKTIRSTLVSKNLIAEEELPDETEISTHIDNASNYSEIRKYVSDHIRDIIQICKELGEKKVKKPIRMAQKYVDENYASSLKLQDVSDMVFMSSNYFSTAFKAQTGMNFIDYVTKVRIEKAKELLRKSLMNVSEIANAIGFSDVKYFSKLFIKNVGIKPIEYRKFYS